MELLKKYAYQLNIPISEDQLLAFSIYERLLLEWNSKFNITRITNHNDIQIKHFLDSITLCRFIPSLVPIPNSLVDIGSGGGFPGIPLKIMMPHIQLTLIEATRKKCDFLLHLSKILNLTKVEVLNDRAETLGHQSKFRSRFDLVTSRALAQTATVVELSAGFCKNGGNIIAWKSPKSANLSDGARVLSTLTSSESPKIIEHITTIPELAYSQSLVQIPKLADIKIFYPRDNGIPKKRPL
tara:strand:+ start:18362 stop:19081 length:720 start_codon:yes stop_codon:yes gene_type:complete